MDAVTIKFKASGQQLSVVNTNLFAANTVSYIRAEFELGYNWDGFDSVRAVWATDFAKIATVLDSDGACTIPWEVLKRTATLYVNLVGSISDGDELTDRLTTYKVKVLDVNGCTNVDGDNTQPITPSQFEQFVAVVHDDAEAAADARDEARGYADDAEDYKDQAKGYADDAEAAAEEIRNMTATATTLPEGSSATASYSDGVLSLGIPKGDTGATGATGNGIASAVLNADYTLTLNFTDGTHYTTPPIRGAQGVQGETGNGIDRIELTDTTGAVKTYTIYFTDGTTYDFDVTDGEVTLAELASALPTDTASGAIASFPDGSDLFDYLSCVVDIEPHQDLHGYDNPWVGGSGKNKLPSSTTQTINGVTFTANADGTITADNTATATADYYFVGANGVYDYIGNITTGSYKLSGNTLGGGTSALFIVEEGGTVLAQQTDGNDATVTLDSTKKYRIFIRVHNGKTVSNQKYYPMLRASTSDGTFEPYENICPISGRTEVVTQRTGKNLCEFDNATNPNRNQFTYSSETENSIIATKSANGGVFYAQYKMDIKANVQYRVSAGDVMVGTNPRINVYIYSDVLWGSAILSNKFINANGSITFTLDKDYENAVIGLFVNGNAGLEINVQNFMVSLASDADTSYEPYNGTTYSITWQDDAGTVYGGTVDVVTGVLTVDRASVDLGAVDYAMYGSGFSRARFRTTALEQLIKKPPNNNTPVEAFSSIFDLVNWGTGNSTNVVGVFGVDTDGDLSVWLNASDYSDATAFKTAMSGQTVVYELATPITYQLDPVQVACLLGQNNVWADTGDIREVKYKADVQLYIDKMLNA